jgi:hypothetical protein
MHHHLVGPFWGNLVLIAVAGAVTLGCFVAVFWMLIHPGEVDRNHPKHEILRDDQGNEV